MLKPVVQEDVTGFAIASVAALAGVSYRKANAVAKLLGIDVTDETLWSDTVHVRTLLAHYHIKAVPSKMPFRSWESLPDLALLSTKWHVYKGRPLWHWVVFVRRNGISQVLDSKRSLRHHRRTDFGRIKPKWAFHVVNSLQSTPTH